MSKLHAYEGLKYPKLPMNVVCEIVRDTGRAVVLVRQHSSAPPPPPPASLPHPMINQLTF